ncbi:mannose-1-phosphate guanylyltransferase/mannose-6-phosphate isomerase [Exilibacterium tricleocarpae]|uniref:mannose-1-phosphate guanylyltransferase n=1 Tax=Exilibacterium tricleocarpae TaxID=2591008 RepID=A0A545T873_9GAMM|nr:mannose-1-phosphate guanylyltransferase/mannose-6-phosphate isomerase [Exilibacterium tricleocarpae]TQV73423.1 mannose-1-phosphate guanylyltransferase/mannose-6-phosphate isomerase [Exilibacterium tricleocarpae]
MLAVILSGGSGTRLWPLSRRAYPKQFIDLIDTNSLLQNTVARALEVTDNAPPLLVCNQEHRFFIAEQLRQLGVGAAGILLEPEAKNTAPAIAAAAAHALHEDESDPVLLVMPADHVIRDIAAFKAAVDIARPAAEAGKLVTFGIVPAVPETGYGYIHRGEETGAGTYKVRQFVEKPDLETACRYLEQGDYYWNSGMFLFKASTLLGQLEKFEPDMVAAVGDAYKQAHKDLDFIRLEPAGFARCRAESIDYALMEKADDVVVVPLDAQWNDIGSWSAIWDVAEKDARGNCSIGDVISHDTTNSYLYSGGKLLATVGLDNIVAIETDDAVLVADKDRVQDVKAIVKALETSDRDEIDYHRKVYRPWGYYDSVDMGERFQVKRIVVNPGQQLSLQMHHHRAEHWIVVQGTAKVVRGEDEYLVTENESTYIPLGVKHRLENPGAIPLEIIEIQSGSYLGEDDIVRFSDNYGRN